MSFYKFKLIALWLLMGATVQAQERIGATLTEKVKEYSNKNLAEKLFVHVDREFYLAGEILWFKIYEVDGSQQKTLPLSRVAYVELLDKDNQPVVQQKIGLENGFGDGSMVLPTSINTGTYLFRAYTNWMKNFGPDFYFQKKISVVNSLIKRSHSPTLQPPRIEAGFFPEGGSLIAGINNKIGFKVSNEFGRGIDFSGFLVNERNDTVARFSPLKFGMGNFSFTPSGGSKYRVFVKTGNQRRAVDFPPASDGYALRLVKAGDQLKISVFHPLAVKNEPVCLFIHSGQTTISAAVKFLKNDSVSFWISKSDMPEGISHITLFTKDLQPVCERLYFKKPSATLSFDLQTDKTAYSKREKVTLSLQTNLNSNLSASIFRLDSLGADATTHISEYLWMTSELKGFIESPGYYFGDDQFAEEAQDNLMLTQGWRRFKWKDVLEQRQLVHFPPEHGGHFIQAAILDEKNEPAPNAIGLLSVIGKNANLNSAQSDEKGDVFFEVKNLVGQRKLALQAAHESMNHIEIKNAFSPEYSPNNLLDASLPSSLRNKLLDRSISLQAQHIYTEDEIKKTRLQSIDSLPFYGSTGEEYLLDDFTRFPVMEEVMREYVAGVMLRKSDDKFRFVLVDVNNRGVFSESPLILLDGVPLYEENEIMNFDPLRLKKIEVIRQKYFLGPSAFPGAVIFTTYKGDLGGFQLNPKCITLDYEGLELQREFYAPDYSVKSDARIPDFRSLIYWNPFIETKSKAQHKFEFFTSDLPGKYRVVIEGLSTNGTSGHAAYVFTVE